MFAKIFALFALLAVAFAAPHPDPKPQYLTYSTGLDYVYPGSAVVPSSFAATTYTGYPAVAPVAYVR